MSHLLARPRFLWTFFAVGLLLFAQAALIVRGGSPLSLLVLPGFFALVLAGFRFLFDPFAVLAAFLVVVVNLDFFRFGGVSSDILLSAFLAWAFLVRGHLASTHTALKKVEIAYLVFLAAAFISVAGSVDTTQSLKRWGRDVQYLVFLAFLLRFPTTFRQRRFLVGALLASSVVPSVLGLAGVQFGIDSFLASDAVLGEGESATRVRSTLSHPGTLCLYLSVLSTLTMALILDGRWFSRVWLSILLALQLVVNYLTYLRGGWVVFVFCIGFWLWVSGRRRLVLLGMPLAAIALLILLPDFADRWSNAFANTEDNSLIWRLGLWLHALEVFEARPMFGSGPGTFGEYVAYGKGFAPHKVWIGRLVETGIVGLLAYLALLFTVTVQLRRQHLSHRGNPLFEATYGVWLGLLLGSFVSDVLSLPSVMIYVWALVGLCLGAQKDDASVSGTTLDSRGQVAVPRPTVR